MNLSRASAPLALYLLAGVAQATMPSFHLLGSEQNHFVAAAISGNGERVVGICQFPPAGQYESVYADWRLSLTPTIFQPGARLTPAGVSFDGGVIVGTSYVGITQPFRYSNGTLTYITPESGSFYAHCNDVSGDGDTIVGETWQPGVGTSGALWNANSGWSFLAHLSSSNCAQASATAISGNGQLIAGSAHHCGDHGTQIEYEGVTWNPAIAALGWQENAFTTVLQKISADGSTVVGYRIVSIGGGYESPLEYTPCRWTSAGIEYLAAPLFNSHAGANDVSGDGNVIVGVYQGAAFVWFEDIGMYNLNVYASESLGLNLDGWVLVNATAISDDGTVVIGSARRNDQETAFVLDLGTPCIADYNHDGIADFFDYLEFLQDFSQGIMTADVNHDQVLDFFDYLDFVQVFSMGCT